MRHAACWLIVGACAGAAPRERAPAPGPLCAGLSDDACQDRALIQSLCLVDPSHASCAPLRAHGWLPPPPPPLTELQRCWAVIEPRADVAATWVCLAPDGVAVRVGDRWDVWPHDAWRREDTPRLAGWTTHAADGRTLWLTVAGARLHLADDTGLVATWLGDGDAIQRGEVEAQHARLPTPAAVCAAARACRAAIPQPMVPGDAELELPEDPIASAVTLRACLDAWSSAAHDLAFLSNLTAPTRAGPPPACGTLERSEWSTTITAPPAFRGLVPSWP